MSKSEDHKRKMSDNAKGNTIWLGRKHTSQTIVKMKTRARINSIKRRETQRANGEPDFPVIGIIERVYRKAAVKRFYKPDEIIIQDPKFKYTIGRIPDFVDESRKLVYLFNEKRHYLDKKEQNIYDEDMALTIKDYESIGYTVFIVSEREWEEDKKFVFKRLQLLLQELDKIEKKII